MKRRETGGNRGALRISAGVLTALGLMAAAALNAGRLEQPRGRHVAGVLVSESAGVRCRASPPGCADTLYSFPCPGNWALGLAWDGSCFWVSDITDMPHIFRLDTTGQVVRQLPPRRASDVEWVGTSLWCTDEEDATLTEIDPLTGDSIRAFMLPDSASEDPNCMGLAWDGSYLWVSKYADSARLYRIDTATGRPVFSFPAPTEDIIGIAWDGAYLWGVDAWNGWIYKMNPPDSSVVDSFPWPLIYATGLEWVGSDIWNVSSGGGGGAGTNRVYRLGGLTTIIENDAAQPPGPKVSIRPNPFRTMTRISWATSGCSVTELAVFDSQGRRVRTLACRAMPGPGAGATWDGADDLGHALPAGCYFVTLRTKGRTTAAKLLVER